MYGHAVASPHGIRPSSWAGKVTRIIPADYQTNNDSLIERNDQIIKRHGITEKNAGEYLASKKAAPSPVAKTGRFHLSS